MEASSYKELNETLIPVGSINLLPTAAIYGANSSGKSNLIKGLFTMRRVVLSSVKLNPGDTLEYDPFILDRHSANEPTMFEIEFIIDNEKFRYGFKYNNVEIDEEWLYQQKPKTREYKLFIRKGNDYEISTTLFEEGIGKADSTLPNRLFISLVSQLNGNVSTKIIEWFRKCVFLSDRRESRASSSYYIKMFAEHAEGFEEALKFLQDARLGFNEIQVEKQPMTDDFIGSLGLPEPLKRQLMSAADSKALIKLMTTHNIYDAEGRIMDVKPFDEQKMESEGTKKLIEYSGPLFLALNTGRAVIIDELDAKLHPLLTRRILALFKNREINKNGAQLIFTTHDTNLLGKDYLRRDQIWLTEKKECETTDIYPLSVLAGGGKKIRKDRIIEKDYIQGLYGAIPYFNASFIDDDEPTEKQRKYKPIR
ncbi:MAG: ATP-binding protein [Prevotella sp.]|jgi:AAA15 family ATPase/GTPase|nr:ATP-binding protein [Prevotella sp.]